MRYLSRCRIRIWHQAWYCDQTLKCDRKIAPLDYLLQFSQLFSEFIFIAALITYMGIYQISLCVQNRCKWYGRKIKNLFGFGIRIMIYFKWPFLLRNCGLDTAGSSGIVGTDR